MCIGEALQQILTSGEAVLLPAAAEEAAIKDATGLGESTSSLPLTGEGSAATIPPGATTAAPPAGALGAPLELVTREMLFIR